MKVYFNQSLWTSEDNITGIAGTPKKVDLKFIYDSQVYHIPFIYQFPEGITLDIISLLDTKKILYFYKKYKDQVDKMNEEDIMFIEKESPIQKLPLHKVYINNKLAGTRGSSTISYIEGIDENKNNEILNEIKRDYKILNKENISFQCMRVHIKFAEDSQKEIRNLKITTHKTEILLSIKEHFTIDLINQEKEYEVSFIHPLTFTEHHIYINEVKKCNAKEVFQKHSENEPFNYAIISYEINPLLNKDERLLVQEIKQQDEERKNNSMASSIGIIGGTGKDELGKHGSPLKHLFTNMYYKNLTSAELSIVGIYIEKCPEQEIILQNL